MWKNNTLHTTVRSGRLPDITDHSSGQQEWQHHYKELRSIQFTIRRGNRASTQNIVFRTLEAQIRQNYNRDITMEHPLMPWIVRRSACVINRYAVHSNERTSYFNRWNREQLCEFGETVQYMLPTVKQFPKLEPRFYKPIWLGKDTTTSESLLGIYNRIVRARTIRRQMMPHKHNQQQLDCVNTGPWNTPASALPTPTLTTPPDAIYRQSNIITEGCNNKYNSRRQKTEHVTGKRSTNKAGKDR